MIGENQLMIESDRNEVFDHKMAWLRANGLLDKLYNISLKFKGLDDIRE